LTGLLRRATNVSYNCLSVDGDTSTNDTPMLLANGASGVELAGADFDRFEGALTEVCQSLAQQIAADGEGASRLITIEVSGCASDEEAQRIARSIANSPLVKTAVAGQDPNWGRILCAAGYAGVAFDPLSVSIALQGVRVCENGLRADFDEQKLIRAMEKDRCQIDFHIHSGGDGRATFWTCDFTEAYVHINAEYRT
jgi:glutamate N-acetyltransferase/amino-acid N-acetyltransferase